jgi:hypothetical protein
VDFLTQLERLSATRADWYNEVLYTGWDDTDAEILSLMCEFGWAERSILLDTVDFYYLTRKGHALANEIETFVEWLLGGTS